MCLAQEEGALREHAVPDTLIDRWLDHDRRLEAADDDRREGPKRHIAQLDIHVPREHAQKDPGERRVLIIRYGPHWGNDRYGYQPSPELVARLTPERRKIVQPLPPKVPPGK